MSRTFSVGEMIAHNGKIAADYGNNMPDWDREFSENLKTKYEQFGPKTFISDKQAYHISRIFKSTGGPDSEEVAKQDKHGFNDPNSIDSDDMPF